MPRLGPRVPASVIRELLAQGMSQAAVARAAGVSAVTAHRIASGKTVGLTAVERFNRYFIRGDGCWEWIGGCTANGYGNFKVDGRQVGAHRFAWEQVHGEPVPTGLEVCHTCDNPSCVRGDHLFLGTTQDNAVDRQAKGRRRKSRRQRETAFAS
ncbi:MAG: HNH endonuclease [Candidatus Dormibacteria bacterium]